MNKIVAITQDYPITSYDSVYLEAAIRFNSVLASLDKILSNIAVKIEIEVEKL